MAIGSDRSRRRGHEVSKQFYRGFGVLHMYIVIICIWRPRDGSWWLLYMNM